MLLGHDIAYWKGGTEEERESAILHSGMREKQKCRPSSLMYQAISSDRFTLPVDGVWLAMVVVKPLSEVRKEVEENKSISDKSVL